MSLGGKHISKGDCADTSSTSGKLSGLMLNGKEYGKDVKEAKKELDSRFEDFNEQAQLCAQRRLARTEDSVQNIEMAMQKLGGSLTGGHSVLNSLDSEPFANVCPFRSQRNIC